MEYDQYLVTCLDDEIDGSRQRLLATRRVFTSRDEAREYCAGLSPARQPEIIGCPFPITADLRPDENPASHPA